MKNKNDTNKNYFKEGQDWYADRYESVTIQSNRWFIGFIASTTLSILLVILIITLFPLKTLVPLVVHHNTTTGEVWVDHPKSPYMPANDAEVESDIVRYITTYESYTAADIKRRFQDVILLSANRVGNQYAEEQSNANKLSPVNVLGKDGIRTVRVEDIIFIGMQEGDKANEPSHNLAKVDFSTTTINHAGNSKVDSWVATIGWTYKGLPSNQEEAWD
ncbi:MAG: type IV secretion system protein, partial [Gammaproteobacteria bacterium]